MAEEASEKGEPKLGSIPQCTPFFGVVAIREDLEGLGRLRGQMLRTRSCDRDSAYQTPTAPPPGNCKFASHDVLMVAERSTRDQGLSFFLRRRRDYHMNVS